MSPFLKHDLDRPLTALFVACFHGNDVVVERLLQMGVVNERKPLLSGRDSVQVAATRDHARCVELLCKILFICSFSVLIFAYFGIFAK